jgi:hypothetical protein
MGQGTGPKILAMGKKKNTKRHSRTAPSA